MKPFEQLLSQARLSPAYQNYCRVRTRVFDMLEESCAAEDGADASDYWQEELAGFEYLLDASPLIVQRLREHCYHLTGLLSYPYRSHHSHKSYKLRKKLEALQTVDKSGLCVPEARAMGGFGYEINGELFNIDTLKFYESMIALDKGGALDSFNTMNGERQAVMEIGSGWGGFCYQFKRLFPAVTYICVDLPQTLLFSAVYLLTVFPESRILIYGDTAPADTFRNWDRYDIILMPNYILDRLTLPPISLGINMVSFQEMTTAQVEDYIRALAANGCPSLYSHNRDRSPHNQELSFVSDIMKRYYNVTEISVLDIPYTNLNVKDAAICGKRSLLDTLKSLFKFNDNCESLHNFTAYRHLLGTLKPGLLTGISVAGYDGFSSGVVSGDEKRACD